MSSRSPPAAPRQQGFRGPRKVSAPSAVETSPQPVVARTEQQRRRLIEFEKQLGALDTTPPGSHPGSGVRREVVSGGTASGGGAAPGDQMAALERWRAPSPPSNPTTSDWLTARAEERLKRLEKYEAHLDGATSSAGGSPAASEGATFSRAEGRCAAPRAGTGSPAWTAQLEDQLKLESGAKEKKKLHEYLPSAKTISRPQLTHLNGLKAMACLWVVSSHYIQRGYVLAGMLERGYVPVCFFVVLSGFLTHYSSIDKPLQTRQQLLTFHAARLGRILPL
jgi:hypothetical protein